MMSPTRGVPSWTLVAAALLPLIVFFAELGTPALWDPDEGRHAEIAREMLLTGNWLQPQLNFEPYREKLPPYYWLVGASLRFGPGDGELATRLPSAVFALIGVWATLAFGWRTFGPRAGVLAAVVLATSGGYVGSGRLTLVDGSYAVLLALALFGMGRVLVAADAPPRFPFGLWLPLAAAAAIRGPVALLFAALVGLGFVVLVRDPGRLWRLRPIRGGLLLATLVGPLVAVLATRDPGYLPEFFWRYNVLRFLSADLPGSHEESAFFYLWMTPLLLLPWSLLLPWTLGSALRPDGERPDATRFLLVWAGTVVAFFTASAAKLASYAVPALFPLALLTARFLDRQLDRPPTSRLQDPVMLAGSLLFAVVLLAPVVGYQIVERLFPSYADRTVYLLLLVPFAVPSLAAVVVRSRTGVLAGMVACSVVVVIGLYRFGSATVSAYNSLEIPARLVAAGLPRDASLLCYGTTSHSLSFYAERPVRTLESLDLADSLFDGRVPVALLTKDRHLPEIRARLSGALYYWWESDSNKVLLVNRPPPPGADTRILLPLAASERRRVPAD